MAKAPELCEACAAKHREYIAALQREACQRRLERGSCARCGTRKPLAGRTLCRACAADAARRSRESYGRRRAPKGTTRCGLCGELGHNRARCTR